MGSTTVLSPLPTQLDSSPGDEIATLRSMLRTAFGVGFHIWDGATGECLFAEPEQGLGDPQLVAELARSVAAADRPEVIAEAGCAVMLAIPVPLSHGARAAATATFRHAECISPEDLRSAAELLGWTEEQTQAWARTQEAWPGNMLLRVARAVTAQWVSELRSRQFEEDLETLSDNLSSTYEEICILHAATQNLRISRSEDEMAAILLRRILDGLPVRAAAIQLLPVAGTEEATYDARTETTFITEGACPLDSDEFTSLIESAGLGLQSGPYVMNRNAQLEWKRPGTDLREALIVPLTDGEHLFGWFAVFNHSDDGEFGTVEANLLCSLASMLGIHTGNRELYRQQHEFLAIVVRALTSAIDAKDPYTCGHSDRVARMSVRLAEQLGMEGKLLDTIYMGGLLHDTGKIGVNDAVLRKPGKLTAEEYDQIKLHPEIGYTILRDLKQLKSCLPAVLHHHEQWDGGGYPHGLAGEDIPYIARIMAVADAYDAMHSDRPYRKGMPSERVEQILCQGAGTQWDPHVVAAFFECRDAIRQISERERADLTLDVKKWTCH